MKAVPKNAGAVPKPPVRQAHPLRDVALPLAAGIWIGLSLLKFGNPIILDRMIESPRNSVELLIHPWPFAWGCLLSAIVLAIGFFAARFEVPNRNWTLWLPAAWFGWQIMAGANTVAPHLTNPTLVHFGICVLAFYLGYFSLAHSSRMSLFWVPILAAFCWALFQGLDQHYGGLEASRRAFYEQENWQLYPKEYLLKLATNRVFSTLVYPNAFAGAILLFAPVLLWQLWGLSARWPRVLRGVAVGVLGYLSAACLYWTGSKGGWLIAMALAGILLLQIPGRKRLKITAVTAVAVIGLAAFFVKFSAYFQKGAPSVGARFNYWNAAWKTSLDNPFLGTGPGTFAVPYARIKPANAEMARLVHNDYLEQASDSGWIGFGLYALFITSALWTLYHKAGRRGWDFRLVWLGLLAWSFHGLIEFGLYIPALAWPAFLLFGWGLGQKPEPTDHA